MPVRAQQSDRPTAIPTPFAKYVPGSAKFFLRIAKPTETDRALRRANAWPFLTLLAGRDLHSASAVRLSDAVSAFFGSDSTITVDDLMRGELSFVINSWEELGGAVWLLRPPDETVLDRWFPQQARPPGPSARPIRSLRAPDGLRGVLGGDVLVLGRRTGKNSLLRHCALLMIERRRDALTRAPNFRKLSSYLRDDALATAYLAGDKSESIQTHLALPLPTLQQAVVGLYERQGVLDLEIHGIRPKPTKTTSVSGDAFGRLVRLPQGTMLGVATTIRPERWLAMVRGAIDRILPELADEEEETSTGGGLFDHLGSQLVVTVEQNDVNPDAPTQVALLLRCTKTQTLIAEVDRVVRRILQLIERLDPVDEQSRLLIQRESHLGVPIHFLSIKKYVAASRFPSLALFQGSDPAWAVWGDWLILSLDREYIKRIVDAQYGLAPTLATLPDVQEMNFYRAQRSTVAIVQPLLITAAMARWLKDYDAGLPSLLDPRFWESPDVDETFLLEQLGVILGDEFEPGEVSVGEVLPDTPVAGAIVEGDRIVGLDGALLDLEFPEASLRRMFLRKTTNTPSTLRLLRNGTMMDVAVTYAAEGGNQADAPPLPAEAVRSLLAVMKTLQFAKFTVFTTSGRAYSSKLSLRFARPGGR